MQGPRDPADIRRREPLAAAVDPHGVSADRAMRGQLDAIGGPAERAEEGAFLAHRINRTIAHTWGFSGVLAG
jgi:hypothetical protein